MSTFPCACGGATAVIDESEFTVNNEAIVPPNITSVA